MYVYQILLFAFFCSLAASNELQCYDCDPTANSGCINPAECNVKTTDCHDIPSTLTRVKKQINDIYKLDVEARGNPAERSFECFSLYFEAAPDSGIITGFYRGCNEKYGDILSSCELLKEPLNTGDVVYCDSCAEDKCNVHDFERGAAEVVVSLTIFNLMLCVMFVSILVLAFFCVRVLRNN